MTIEHYIVFIGAGASLSTDLASLERRISKSKVVAPAMKKQHVGTTDTAVRLTAVKLYNELVVEDSPSEKARLYLWMYQPTNFEQLELVWRTFGHASWLETVPRDYLDKVTATRAYLEERINEIRPSLHEMSISTYARRKSSPLTLPLRNFSSQITRELKGYWYNNLERTELSRRIKAFKTRYLQSKRSDRNGYRDDKALIFQPANDSECHGKPHPIGEDCKTFLCSRFRYGVSLFPGFHFDVTAENTSTIQCELRTAAGNTRAIRSEKRTHINIFPNDFLLPVK